MQAQSNVILIRADAGGAHGIGHVMRMIALAQAWQDDNGHVTMACTSCPKDVISRIISENISFHSLSNHHPGSVKDQEETLELALKLDCNWIVLDGYHFSVEYQTAIKKKGFHLLCLDDYGHCDHWTADIVLNQNFHAPTLYKRYAEKSPSTKFLLGTEYVLLRREFRTNYKTNKHVTSLFETRMLITFGGVDEDNWTEKILLILLNMPPIKLTVVLGTGNLHINKVTALLVNNYPSARVIQGTDDMASLYINNDCVISAAGSSSYEWLRYRLPALVFVIADNQKPLANFLEKIPNVAVICKQERLNVDQIEIAINLLKKNVSSRNIPPQLIDSFGAARVIENIRNHG